MWQVFLPVIMSTCLGEETAKNWKLKYEEGRWLSPHWKQRAFAFKCKSPICYVPWWKKGSVHCVLTLKTHKGMYSAKGKNKVGLTRDFLLFKLSKVKRIIKPLLKWTLALLLIISRTISSLIICFTMQSFQIHIILKIRFIKLYNYSAKLHLMFMETELFTSP